MGAILTFFAGPWGAVIQKALMVLSIAGLIYIGITQYNHNIREGQALKDQNTILVQLQKDNQALQQKLVNIEQINNDIIIKLDAKNKEATVLHDKVTTYITSPQAQKDNKESSPVLKNTIGILRNEK